MPKRLCGTPDEKRRVMRMDYSSDIESTRPSWMCPSMKTLRRFNEMFDDSEPEFFYPKPIDQFTK